MPTLPEPIEVGYAPAQHNDEGWWLVLSDVHMPFHDKRTVELAVERAVELKAHGVLLNGDILDCHELSRWEKSPDDPRIKSEIEMGKELLAWLRGKLPRAKIVWKDGNHEERLHAYLLANARALYGLAAVSWPSLLEFAKRRVHYVSDRRIVRLGELNVIHGHEYRPNITAPVNPARGLFLRAKNVALCGHFHQTSEHHEPTITGKAQGAWSTGCACNLAPRYMPLNKWNHGFAMVYLRRGGRFEVRNHRVLDGQIV
jgi:predicted phosphodiesterase